MTFKCSKVWLRVDRVRKSLEAPYTGPYFVIERNPKYFVIKISDDVHKTVSIDRLKPCSQKFISEDSVENNNSDNLTNINNNCDIDVCDDRDSVAINNDLSIGENPNIQCDNLPNIPCDNLPYNQCDNLPNDQCDKLPRNLGNEHHSRSGRKITFKADPNYYYF